MHCIKSMSMEITYLSKMYYHSKFQGPVLSGGYASVTTKCLSWLTCWFCSKQLRDTRFDVQSCSAAVWPQGTMLCSPSLRLYMPQKSRFVIMYVSCLTMCACVFWCAQVVVVVRQLHRWQLCALNCAFRKKKKDVTNPCSYHKEGRTKGWT